MNKASFFIHSKIYLTFLIFAIMFISFGCAETIDFSGSSKSNEFTLATVPTTLPKDNTWTITDSGDTATTVNFEGLRDLLIKAKGREIKLDFPNIEKIPDNAFFNPATIDVKVETTFSVSAKKVMNIGENAFYNCTGLTDVDFAEVTTIGARAFRGCKKLGTVNFQKATIIGVSAFHDCIALETVFIPKVQVIESSTFQGCTTLKTVDVSSATTIGASAFSNCTTLKTVDFPLATIIKDHAFSGCTALKTVEFPLATTINSDAFINCKSLVDINFPLVETINGNAFMSCSGLKSISFPKTKTIGASAFAGYSSLATMTVATQGELTIATDAFGGSIPDNTIQVTTHTENIAIFNELGFNNVNVTTKP